MKSKKDKNCDIQILRAVAIAAVLGFHLRPEYAPQGYLGVDIFFVISGYLMTSILDGKTLTLNSTLQFYERRLKRLLPAYLLVILLTLAATSAYLISTDYEFLKTDALWALGFGTNFQSMFEKETYFKLVSDYKFLLHTWSLSVEFQYYFLAPFILIPIGASQNPLIPTFCIFIASFIFQVFIPFQTVAFGLVFSRIWQFLAGTIVFHYQQSKTTKLYSQLPEEDVIAGIDCDVEGGEGEDMEPQKPRTKTIVNQDGGANFNPNLLIFTALIGICFMPQFSDHYIYVAALRLVSILLSALAIYFGHQSTPGGRFAWIKKFGIYVGDISYSLYLLHWPIIIFAKYQGWFDDIELSQILGIILLPTIIQYHCFEKVLLHQSSKLVFFIVVLFYLFSTILLTQTQGLGFTHVADPAIARNQEIAKECKSLPLVCNWDPKMLEIARKPTKSAAYFCSYDGSGNATIFFTGNSFALRQLSAVQKSLNKVYKKLYFAARPACLTFESFNKGYGGYWQCDEIMNKTVEFLEKLKPDFLIITEKLSGNDNFKKASKNLTTDPTVKRLAEYFKLWSPFTTKKIFHIEPHPTLWFNPATTLAKEIAQGKNISHRVLPLKKLKAEVDPGWNRIKAAMKDCPKCAPIEMRNAFTENGNFYLFDKKTKFSLYCDNGHLSPVGTDRMVPILEKVIRNEL